MRTLTEIVRKCAQKVKYENTPLVLYAASAFCGRVVRAFRNVGVQPSCICDGDENKQGKVYYELGVISPAEAAAQYPGANFFITSGLHAPEIIGHLVNNLDVPPKQILNFEEVEWKKSCVHLESEANLIANHSIAYFCCFDFGKKMSPSVSIDCNYSESVTKFIQQRDNLISELQNGTSDSLCAECAMFKEGYFFVNRKLRKIFYNDSGGCNFRCIYCKNSTKRPVDLKNPDPINFVELVSVLQRKNEISKDVKLIMAPGEFTIHPERASLYELCDFAEYILTNGAIFDENVNRILANGNTALEISIDAGTRETFKHIKGFDLFDRVVENIKRYTENYNSSVHLKYIFLPGINENVDDVHGFVDICKNSNIDFAVISYDIYLENNVISDNTLKMMKAMADAFNNNGILFADYSGLTKTKRYKELSDIKHKHYLQGVLW